MANIAQETAPRGAKNLQIEIPDLLKRELGSLAGEFGCYPRDLVTEALEHYLPVKRQQAKKLRDAEAIKANGKKR